MTSISRDRRTHRRPMDNTSELVHMLGQVTGGRGIRVASDGLTRTVISLQLLDSPVELPLLMPGSGSSPPMKSGAISNANIFLCGRRASISGTFFVIPRSHLSSSGQTMGRDVEQRPREYTGQKRRYPLHFNRFIRPRGPGVAVARGDTGGLFQGARHARGSPGTGSTPGTLKLYRFSWSMWHIKDGAAGNSILGRLFCIGFCWPCMRPHLAPLQHARLACRNSVPCRP